MLQGKFAGQYRKAGTQRMVFKYTVIGTPDEVKAYEEAQGDNLIHDDNGRPLLFTITPGVGNTVGIIQTGGFNGSPIQYRRRPCSTKSGTVRRCSRAPAGHDVTHLMQSGPSGSDGGVFSGRPSWRIRQSMRRSRN